MSLLQDANGYGKISVMNNVGNPICHFDSIGDSFIKSGKLGIGITSPTAKLYVNNGGGSTYSGANDVFRNTSTNGIHSLILGTDGWTNASVLQNLTGAAPAPSPTFGLYLNSAYGSRTFSSSSIHVNCGQSNGDIRFSTGDGNTNPTEKMRIANNGYVGIGTTGPVGYLHVAGHHSSVRPFILDRGTFGTQTNGAYDPVIGGFIWQDFRHNNITDWTIGGQTDQSDGTTPANLSISNPTEVVLQLVQPQTNASGKVEVLGSNYLNFVSPIDKKIAFTKVSSGGGAIGNSVSLEMNGASLAVFNQSSAKYLASFYTNGVFQLNNIPCSNNIAPSSQMTGATITIFPASSGFGTGKSKDTALSWGPIIDTSGGPADYTIDNTDLLLGTVNTNGNPVEIAKFSHTGQVRIGLKSEEMMINGTNPTQYRNYGEIPGGTLEIRDERNKNATDAHLRIVGGATSATTGSHYIDNAGGVAKYIISQDIVGGEIRMISSSGGVKLPSGSTGWVTASSDKRSKENVSLLENVLDKVLKLSPSRYDYKEEYGNKDQIGFIAQDVEEVLPEFYIPGSTEEEMSTVKFSDNATTALLVKAIQEQQQLIEDLKSRIETLENK